MKSLITRFASIGTIFSLVLAGLSATALAVILPPPPPNATSVHTHRSVVSTGTYAGLVAKVTAVCSNGTGKVRVTIVQMAAQNSVDGTTATASSSSNSFDSPVVCDNTSRTIAVHINTSNVDGAPNLGAASATTTLTVTPPSMVPPATTTETNQPVEVVFPVGENHEEESPGGYDE
jgi:hypothetical protein